MARMLKWLGIATLSFGLTGSLVGCVPQEKYNAKLLECQELTEQLNAAQTDAGNSHQEALAYKSELDKNNEELQTQSAMNANLQKQLQDLTGENADLKGRYDTLASKPPQITEVYQGGGGGTALPAQLSNELSDFAAANPGLVEFDAVRGIVKFKSDVTFAPGSDALNPGAKSVIDKFATILNASGASRYDLMVAGHTDNVPVSNPETLRKFGNNITLSAHRAISVYTELAGEGVALTRMGVTGYGAERPVADNNSTAGRNANRRVEVMILSTHHVGPAITAGEKLTPSRRRDAELNKDGGMSAAPSALAPETPAILTK